MNLLKISSLFSQRFPIVLLAAIVIGVSVPGLDRVPTHVITLLLALQIFFSCFKVDMGEIRDTHIVSAITFYLGRFVLLPVVVFWVLSFFGCNYDYRVAIFLLSMLPAGVSTPAFTGLLNGSISLALFLVILSSLLCPFVVPVLFELMVGEKLVIDTMAMFNTLVVVVFLPIIAHLPLRKMNHTATWIRKYNAALVVPMVAGTIVIALAKQRQFLFQNWDTPMLSFVVSLVIYLLFYAVVWILSFRTSVRNRIAFTLSSGLNNITLGIVLAMFYFSPDVTVFLVVANVSWVIVLLPFRRFLAARL